jgi:hypothetical protein
MVDEQGVVTESKRGGRRTGESRGEEIELEVMLVKDVVSLSWVSCELVCHEPCCIYAYSCTYPLLHSSA